MFVRSLTLLLAASYAVIADVKIGTPVAGGNYTAGVANFSLQWVDSGTPPITLNISSYQVFLCAGGNEASNFVRLGVLSQGNQTQVSFDDDGDDATVPPATIDASLGASVLNAYFVQLTFVTTTGNTTIVYSSRFSLLGMKGTFPSNVNEGIETISGTAGPSGEEVVSVSTSMTATATASSTSPTSTQSTSSSAPSSTSTPAGVNESDPGESNNLAVGLGAGLGVPLGIILLAGFGFLFWRNVKRRRQNAGQAAGRYHAGLQELPAGNGAAEMESKSQTAEVHGVHKAAELSGLSKPVELEGRA